MPKTTAGANTYPGDACAACGIPSSEIAYMQDRIYQLRGSNGALIVDADRREKRALDTAADCAAHGKEIHYLRHMADWCWSRAERADSAQRAIISALLVTQRDAMQREPGATVPVAEVAEWLAKAVKAQDKVMRRRGFPTFADCQRAGGCDHDGLTESLVKAVAELGQLG